MEKKKNMFSNNVMGHFKFTIICLFLLLFFGGGRWAGLNELRGGARAGGGETHLLRRRRRGRSRSFGLELQETRSAYTLVDFKTVRTFVYVYTCRFTLI